MKVRLFAVFLILVMSLTPAFAMVVGNYGQVTGIGSNSMPSAIIFTLNVPLGACSAGDWLYVFPTSADQAKAIYALLLSAKLSGVGVTVSVDDSTCTVQLLGNGIWLN